MWRTVLHRLWLSGVALLGVVAVIGVPTVWVYKLHDHRVAKAAFDCYGLKSVDAFDPDEYLAQTDKNVRRLDIEPVSFKAEECGLEWDAFWHVWSARGAWEYDRRSELYDWKIPLGATAGFLVPLGLWVGLGFWLRWLFRPAAAAPRPAGS